MTIRTDHAANEAARWAQELLEVLERQRALMDELAPLAEEQGRLIDTGRAEALLELLTRRQAIIDRLLDADQLLGRLTEALSGCWEALEEERRAAVRELAGEVEGRVAAVLRHDREGQERLESVRDGCRRELESIDTGRHAHRAYRQAGEAASRFADERG